jgi:peptidoglycan/xylan/chitin deacetylase (PgdA/CDA1 family)
MRPPYGNSNKKTTEVLNNLGYTIVTWNIDTKDYETHDLNKEMENYKNELPSSNDSAGGIALEHDVN